MILCYYVHSMIYIFLFISEASKQKKTTKKKKELEYIDLVHLLRQNFCPNAETMGTLTVINNQLTVKTGSQ